MGNSFCYLRHGHPYYHSHFFSCAYGKNEVKWLRWEDETRWIFMGRKNEVVGRHHWLDGHESEQALGDGDGQESLACCSPWSRKESDATEQLNWWGKWGNQAKRPTDVHRISHLTNLIMKIPLALLWAFTLETSLHTFFVHLVRFTHIPLPQTFLSPIYLQNHFQSKILSQ